MLLKNFLSPSKICAFRFKDKYVYMYICEGLREWMGVKVLKDTV